MINDIDIEAWETLIRSPTDSTNDDTVVREWEEAYNVGKE